MRARLGRGGDGDLSSDDGGFGDGGHSGLLIVHLILRVLLGGGVHVAGLGGSADLLAIVLPAVVLLSAVQALLQVSREVVAVTELLALAELDDIACVGETSV